MKLSVLLNLKPSPVIKDLLECMYESIENAVDDYEILFSTSGLSEKSIRWLSSWKNSRPIDVEGSSRAKFWNIAFDQIAPDSDLILFFDLDSIVFRNSVRRMIELIQSDSKIGAVGAIMNGGNFGYQRFELDMEDDSDLVEAVEDFERKNMNSRLYQMFLEGSCFIARRDVLDRIRARYNFLVDERFDKNIFDDVDLSMRILLEGFRMEVAIAYVWKVMEVDSKAIEQLQKSEDKIFQEIWGFSQTYSLLSRYDLLEVIPDLTRDGIKILEVGCAAGGTLYAIRVRNQSAELYGIEINSDAARIASAFAEVEDVDVEKFAPEHWHDKFDYIICGDVIEHLIDPWSAIRNMRKMLKPGGHLLASIPNVANIAVVQNLLLGFWDYKDSGILDRTHLRFFTRDSIKKMFANENFKIQNMFSKQYDSQSNLLPFAEELGARFKIDPIHFMTFQYIVDATK